MNARMLAGESFSSLAGIAVEEHRLTPLVRAQMPHFLPHYRKDPSQELAAAQTVFSDKKADLRTSLLRIAESVGVAQRFRTCDVMAHGAHDTSHVIFPDASQIHSQLDFLEKRRARWSTENPLLGELISMVLLLRIHPFPDGNGRTSRCFFSVQLSRLVGRFVYVPWTLAASAHPVCWHLRLREAQARNSWDGILTHALSIIDAMRRTAAESRPVQAWRHDRGVTLNPDAAPTSCYTAPPPPGPSA